MRASRISATLAALALCLAAGCAGHHPSPGASPSALPLLLDDRGIIMPLAKAERSISLRPFLPVKTPLAYAALPGLGGPDIPTTRGIGIEYLTSAGARVILSQWPKQHFTLNFITRDITMTPCLPVLFMHTNLAWTTKRGSLMTLIPDGNMSAKSLLSEARRLLSHGACTARG
ncbi:MAG TPA: hypothetical protein VMV73_06605 [Candidatus Dormibacteraeota bacterium]|nr:hypothetical protein [Candidatus Dormibacteraeota bacterium]